MSKDETFRELVGDDVEELNPVHLALTGRPKEQADFDARRRAAAGEPLDLAARTVDALTLGEVVQVDPWDELAFKRDGVQDGVYRKLRLGKYPIEGTLDLHGHTVREARSALFRFVVEATRRGHRTLVVLHGKGEDSATPARLKSYTNAWLRQLPEVLAFHSAQRHHGGYGATYVLLRKNEVARADTRERHGLKGHRPHTL